MSDARAENYPGPIHNPPVHTDPGYAGHSGEPHAPHQAHHPKLQHHFDNMAQQAEASALGMWLFLVTEIMFFGGLFMAYLVYRWAEPTAFQEASAHLSIWLGGITTAVLDPLEGLTSDDSEADYASLMRENLAAIRKASGCS